MNELDEKIEAVQNSAYAVSRWTKELLEGWGVSPEMNGFVNMLLLSAGIILFTYVFQLIAKRLVIFVLKRLGRIEKLKFANHLLNNRFPMFLAFIVPLTWVRNTIPVAFEYYPKTAVFLTGATNIFIVLMIYWLINAILKSLCQYIMSFERFKDKPINSYFQVGRIFLTILTIAAIFTVLTGITIKGFFTAMGAASAVLMLVFKDTILGFVTSIQVTTNDMVRIGDWVTMPKYNADGDVEQISLTTVKIRNFDKTVVTVPTYSLISDSLQNWRGMQESGGRRIKRSIPIKQSSISYIKAEELEGYKKIQLLEGYITEKQAEIEKYNKESGANKELLLNGRNLTNLGLFRKYAELYLKNHPDIRKDATLMVRQLEPTTQGIPIEIYCFSNTVVWAEYEGIASDIFDHLTAAMPYFNLGIYEQISDAKNLKKVIE